MSEPSLLEAILDSLSEPILVADTDHIIRYMNRAAIAHYSGGKALLGRSLLDCHNPRSQEIILRVLEELRAGAEERLISENEERRVYMRAVRNWPPASLAPVWSSSPAPATPPPRTSRWRSTGSCWTSCASIPDAARPPSTSGVWTGAGPH